MTLKRSPDGGIRENKRREEGSGPVFGARAFSTHGESCAVKYVFIFGRGGV